jgi:hypothetical protein
MSATFRVLPLAFCRLRSDYLVPQLTDPYNAGVLVLLAFIGGFVALEEPAAAPGSRP